MFEKRIVAPEHLLRHAVDAAKIAAIGHRNAQVAQRPPQAVGGKRAGLLPKLDRVNQLSAKRVWPRVRGEADYGKRTRFTARMTLLLNQPFDPEHWIEFPRPQAHNRQPMDAINAAVTAYQVAIVMECCALARQSLANGPQWEILLMVQLNAREREVIARDDKITRIVFQGIRYGYFATRLKDIYTTSVRPNPRHSYCGACMTSWRGRSG